MSPWPNFRDRLYRAMDALLPHKAALEVFLKKRLGLRPPASIKMAAM